MSLANLRKGRGFKQKDIADKLGVAQATVAMWETGKSTPSFKNLCSLSELLQVSVNDICTAMQSKEDE